jgi:hypothetical protein
VFVSEQGHLHVGDRVRRRQQLEPEEVLEHVVLQHRPDHTGPELLGDLVHRGLRRRQGERARAHRGIEQPDVLVRQAQRLPEVPLQRIVHRADDVVHERSRRVVHPLADPLGLVVRGQEVLVEVQDRVRRAGGRMADRTDDRIRRAVEQVQLVRQPDRHRLRHGAAHAERFDCGAQDRDVRRDRLPRSLEVLDRPRLQAHEEQGIGQRLRVRVREVVRLHVGHQRPPVEVPQLTQGVTVGDRRP